MKRHKVIKKTATLLLAMTLVTAGMSLITGGLLKTGITTAAAAETASGTCGENVNWVLDDEGVFTISGEGEMDDYGITQNIPWYSYKDLIKKAVIENGVTSIGSMAFYECGNLTSVTIPDGVKAIALGTFSECSSLTYVSIPDSVESIGAFAFYSCSELSSVAIPDRVKKIELCTFTECSSLSSIIIPDDVEAIEENAFAGCSSLTSVNIPDGVKTIGGFSFCNCTSLASVTIPESVTYIKEYSFSGCTNLTAVVIKAETPPNTGYIPSTFAPKTQLKIYVPNQSVETYKTEWSEFAGNIIGSTPKMDEASLTLNDGFGLNFYIDYLVDTAGYTIKFSGRCDEEGKEVPLAEKNGRLCATANVNAKDINEKITATLCKDGTETDLKLDYSVKDYLMAAIASAKNSKTLALFKSVQIYGLAAEEYFDDTDNGTAELINEYFSENGYTDEKILDLLKSYEAQSAALGDNKVSLVLNSKAKLRVYSDNGNKISQYGRFSEVTGLTPVTMGQDHTIDGYSVSGYTWVYRVLTSKDEAVLSENGNMAKALFIYMKAAAAFDPDDFKLYDLSKVTEDLKVRSGDVLTGKLSDNIKITVVDDGLITLRDVDITCLTVPMAGITCDNNVVIVLEGTNIIKGGPADDITHSYPGIFISDPYTLMIEGTGSLDVSGGDNASGIGGGYGLTCGHINISEATIIATGGDNAPGIGSGEGGSCGCINIDSGNVIARGGKNAPGLGISPKGYSCGDIAISSEVTSVIVTKGEGASDSIIVTGLEGNIRAITIVEGANVVLN